MISWKIRPWAQKHRFSYLISFVPLHIFLVKHHSKGWIVLNTRMITTAAPISLPMTPPLSLHSLSSVKQEISIASVSPDKLSHGIEGNATDRPDSTSRAADTDEQLSLLDVSAAFKSEALALPPSTFASEGSFKHVSAPYHQSPLTRIYIHAHIHTYTYTRTHTYTYHTWGLYIYR